MSETASKGMRKSRLEGAFSKLFTKTAIVTELRDIAPGFRLLTLEGQALRKAAWTPGQKVQLMLGGWVQRTYTPLSWDAASGKTQLLAYAHGGGPGAEWARAVAVGDNCSIFGPRGSLDLTTIERPALLFGDETSFGLAHALRFTPATAQGVHLVLEVTSLADSSAVLDSIGVQGAHLVERRPDDGHFGEVQELAAHLLQTRSIEGGVLSGKASSIQRLSRQLRQLGVARSRIQAKAYWAPGKAGLD